MVLYQDLLTLRLCYIKYIPGFATQVSHGLRREHRFQVSPFMRVRNVLPSKGGCLHSHYLAKGLHATV
jgi:hypothetical protein